jgi:hypothetical protein
MRLLSSGSVTSAQSSLDPALPLLPFPLFLEVLELEDFPLDLLLKPDGIVEDAECGSSEAEGLDPDWDWLARWTVIRGTVLSYIGEVGEVLDSCLTVAMPLPLLLLLRLDFGEVLVREDINGHSAGCDVYTGAESSLPSLLPMEMTTSE